MTAKKDLAHHDHLKTIEIFEKMALGAFLYCMKYAIKDVLKALTHSSGQKLSKSDSKLPFKWVGKVNTINIDVEKLVTPVLESYFESLRYSLFGRLAGKEAMEAAAKTGLASRVVPGILVSAYLDSLDTEMKHYSIITDAAAPVLPAGSMNAALKEIMDRSDMFLSEQFLRIRNNMITNTQNVISDSNYKTLDFVRKRTMDSIPEDETDSARAFRLALEEARERVLNVKKVEKALKDGVKGLAKDYSLATESFIGNASGVATHQYLVEAVGTTGDDSRVVLMTLLDGKVCVECQNWSRDSSGEYIVYNVGMLKPVGYNYGKKKVDWKVCMGSLHHRCRCKWIYLSPAHKVSPEGKIVLI